MLLQSFIESLTVLLPFYPVGTMEVTHKEGQVATANTTAQLFGGLPSCGKPVLKDPSTAVNCSSKSLLLILQQIRCG